MTLLRLLSIVALLGLISACAPTIANDVRANIESHTNLGAHQINISNHRSTVTLAGRVQTEAARAEVERLAWQTEGVETVRNRIVVDPGLGDQQAGTTSPQASRILKAVREDRTVGHPYDLQVSVVGDSAFLDGTVGHSDDIRAIEKLALKQPGVMTVTNRLQVASPLTDGEIRAALDQIISDISREDFQELKFEVSSGVITFKGEASNHTAIDRLLADVNMLAGVKSVNNEITIDGKKYMDAWRAGHRATRS